MHKNGLNYHQHVTMYTNDETHQIQTYIYIFGVPDYLLLKKKSVTAKPSDSNILRCSVGNGIFTTVLLFYKFTTFCTYEFIDANCCQQCVALRVLRCGRTYSRNAWIQLDTALEYLLIYKITYK